MNTKQMTTPAVPAMVRLAMMLAVILLPFISCKKNNAAIVPPLSVQTMADLLEGEILTGYVSTESDEEGLALWCNNRKILIGIEKIVTQPFTDPGSITHAQVVYSNYGIIIRDTDTHQLWYYIQHDDKSKKRFESLPPAGETPVVSGISGTVKIHLS